MYWKDKSLLLRHARRRPEERRNDTDMPKGFILPCLSLFRRLGSLSPYKVQYIDTTEEQSFGASINDEIHPKTDVERRYSDSSGVELTCQIPRGNF